VPLQHGTDTSTVDVAQLAASKLCVAVCGSVLQCVAVHCVNIVASKVQSGEDPRSGEEAVSS